MPGPLDSSQAPQAKTGSRAEQEEGDRVGVGWRPVLQEPDRFKSPSPFLVAPSVSRPEDGRLSPLQLGCPSPVPPAREPPRWHARASRSLARFWRRNRGVVLVAVSQLFGALMNLSARLLELEADMHPLQILFARMSVTTVLSCLYMWWNKVPHFPLGPPGLRWVLVVRGISGFVRTDYLPNCWRLTKSSVAISPPSLPPPHTS